MLEIENCQVTGCRIIFQNLRKQHDIKFQAMACMHLLVNNSLLLTTNVEQDNQKPGSPDHIVLLFQLFVDIFATLSNITVKIYSNDVNMA